VTAGLPFSKYEGLGNDFIVVESADEAAVTPERAALLCDRRFGIGADGVLLVLPARTPGCAVRMRVLNADGSIPEMCGNGVRCVAVHVAAAHGQRGGVVRVETDAGERACALEDDGTITVDMGIVSVLGDRSIDVDGAPVVMTLADAGNPHAILIGSFARSDVERLGPRIATHSAFPRGTNVEFAHLAPGSIELVVWERGVGITMACGTGACATVAVACDKGLVPRNRPQPVDLPGGRLVITVDDAGRATMRGPARRVYSGVLA
jgi:diaminopimelate epimerase